MIVISEYFSDDEKRKTQILKEGRNLVVKVWIDGAEQTQFQRNFVNREVAEWYAEEWVQ